MTYTYVAGRMLCGTLREYLDECKFKGMDIDYLEGKGWIERKFTIKGSDADVKRVGETINRWAAHING